MNRKIPIYIEIEIIICLINYLLINNNGRINIKESKYLKKRFYNNIFEIIKYCLVSKSWFKTVSNLISNRIKENLIENWFLKDYKIGVKPTKYIIEDYITIKVSRNFTKVNNESYQVEKLKINSKWSIIKVNKKDIENYLEFKVRIVYPHRFSNWNIGILSDLLNSSNKYQKTIIIGVQIIDLLNLKIDIPENVEIKSYLSVIDRPLIYQFPVQNQKKKTIDYLKIRGNAQIFQTLYYIKPKNISFFAKPHTLEFPRYNYNEIFGYSNQLESLTIDSCFGEYIEPVQLININKQLTNLKSLSFGLPLILLNDNFKNDNGDNIVLPLTNIQPALTYSNPNNLKYEWNQMIENLTNNNTITNLTIGNPFYNLHIKEDNTIIFILNSFKNIIENNHKIKYLKLKDMDIFFSDRNDIDAYLSFDLNDSIITLVIKDSYGTMDNSGNNHFLYHLISNTFNLEKNNKSYIRNLKLSYDFNGAIINSENRNSIIKKTSFILKHLLLFPNSSLYTIQVPFDIDENLNDLLNLINSSQITIYEIILLIGREFKKENTLLKLNQFIYDFERNYHFKNSKINNINIKFKFTKLDKFIKYNY